jgi:hypothetical protein
MFAMKRMLAMLAGLVPFLCYAHPGHGDTEGFTIIHYLLEPEHLILLLLAIGVVFWLYKSLRGKEEKA